MTCTCHCHKCPYCDGTGRRHEGWLYSYPWPYWARDVLLRSLKKPNKA